jgi:putative membrane protein
MFKSIALLTGAALLCAAPLAAQTAAKAPNSQAATVQADTFIKKVAPNGVAEVGLAQMAETKATDTQVKAFATMLRTDHSKANTELLSIARAKSVTVPEGVSPAHKATRDRLEKLSGAAFDRAYVNEMVQAHRNGIQEFEKASQGADAEIKAFATKTLPTLHHHFDEAQRLAAGARVTDHTGASLRGAALQRRG